MVKIWNRESGELPPRAWLEGKLIQTNICDDCGRICDVVSGCKCARKE